MGNDPTLCRQRIRKQARQHDCYSGFATTLALARSLFSIRLSSAFISRSCRHVLGGEANCVFVSSNGSGVAPIAPLYAHGIEPGSASSGKYASLQRMFSALKSM